MTFCFPDHHDVGPRCLQPLLLCLWGDWRTLTGEEPSQQALSCDCSPRAMALPWARASPGRQHSDPSLSPGGENARTPITAVWASAKEQGATPPPGSAPRGTAQGQRVSIHLCTSGASAGQNLNASGLQQASMRQPLGARNCSRHWGNLPNAGGSLLNGTLHHLHGVLALSCYTFSLRGIAAGYPSV